MQKAQGALEYLLLIGGAILVAVIAIALIINIASSSEQETVIVAANALCSKFPDNECDTHTVSVKEKDYGCFPFGTNRCRAQTGIPITDCGAPTGGWQEGQTYYLVNDIQITPNFATCLTITEDNINLNCMENTVQTFGTSAESIRIAADNVFLSNCIIKSAQSSGIHVAGSNNFIRNNTIEAFQAEILVFVGSINNIILNNDTCGATAGIITINEGATPQSSASGSNICQFCNDLWRDNTGNPSPVCPCETSC